MSALWIKICGMTTPEAVAAEKNNGLTPVLQFTRDDLREAIALIQHFDPVGVAARDLRECLMAQLEHLIKTRDIKPLAHEQLLGSESHDFH